MCLVIFESNFAEIHRCERHVPLTNHLLGLNLLNFVDWCKDGLAAILASIIALFTFLVHQPATKSLRLLLSAKL